LQDFSNKINAIHMHALVILITRTRSYTCMDACSQTDTPTYKHNARTHVYMETFALYSWMYKCV